MSHAGVGTEFGFFCPTGGVDDTASPGFMFDRQGSAKKKDWLKAGNIYSNVVGWPFALANGRLTQIWIGNEDPNTFEIEIYEHQGDEVNLTLLTTVAVGVAARNASFDEGDFGTVNITQDYQIACRVKTGTLKEPRIVLFLVGDT
jgi:hypothetical protein